MYTIFGNKWLYKRARMVFWRETKRFLLENVSKYSDMVGGRREHKIKISLWASTYGWRDKGGSWSERMTDPNTLTHFITSQLDQFATYTFLELWNHGSAYAGFAYDRGPVFTVMSLANMDLALSNAVSTVGKKFTILGFDACYMSSYSVLSRLYFLFNTTLNKKTLLHWALHMRIIFLFRKD